jgi:hypothetical protein
MAHLPLTPDELAALLRHLDEVEAEARCLREQITKAMRLHRTSDRSVASDCGPSSVTKKPCPE